MNHLAAFILRLASVAAWELQGTMRGVVDGARALYRGADRYDADAPAPVRAARPDPVASMINAPGGVRHDR